MEREQSRIKIDNEIRLLLGVINMNKVSKIVLYLLCLIGIATIWEFLNKISDGNITGIRLGDYIMMLIGSINLVNWIGDKIIKL